MRVAFFAIVVAMLVTPAAAQQPTGRQLDQIQKECPSAKEPEALKACVSELLEFVRLMEKGQETYMDLVAKCADAALYEEMKKCIRTMVGHPEQASSSSNDSPPAAVPDPPKPTWYKMEDVSKMDGSAQVVLTLTATDPVAGRYGNQSRPVLILRCRERTTSAYIDGDWFLGQDVPVMMRIDQDKPVQQSWRASTDRKAGGLWTGATAVPFIKGLIGRQTLLVRMTPYSESPREFSFNVSGLADVIEPLRKACQW